MKNVLKKIFKKTFIPITLSVICGAICGRVVFSIYESDNIMAINNSVYLLQAGAYSSYDNMKANTIANNYIYYKDDAHFKRIQETFDGIVIFNDHKGAYSADATTVNFDKGDGIKKILSLLDKYDCETFAFGDGSNDRCMFKAVTHKIAMGNAIDELKNEASYVTKPFDEDGIVHALHHFHIL